MSACKQINVDFSEARLQHVLPSGSMSLFAAFASAVNTVQRNTWRKESVTSLPTFPSDGGGGRVALFLASLQLGGVRK